MSHESREESTPTRPAGFPRYRFLVWYQMEHPFFACLGTRLRFGNVQEAKHFLLTLLHCLGLGPEWRELMLALRDNPRTNIKELCANDTVNRVAQFLVTGRIVVLHRAYYDS